MPLYKQDPNDTSKQIPDIRGENRYDRAVNPTHCKLIKTPNYVLVNTVLTLPVGFFFGSSGSFSELGAAGKSTKANYSVVGDDLPAGTKLNIHPTAWSGSAADAGKITFVYKSGLSTGGF
tara:strand:+ start:7 stop:366 length:360 start_codon:yes stop_codon:yes gene_type:complete